MLHGFSGASLFACAILLSSSVTLSVHVQQQTDTAAIYKNTVNKVWDELTDAERECFYKELAWLPHIIGPNGRRKQKADTPADCQTKCANFTSCEWFDYRPWTGNCFFGAMYTLDIGEPTLAYGAPKTRKHAISGYRNCSNSTDAPTQEPTDAPTQNSTDVPTQEPTDSPTQNPTDAPTQEPTDAPTQEPTDAPTHNSTDVPTQEPTDSPTQNSTDVPTQEPTDSPTTDAPTQEPTDVPTTDAPTQEPTEPTDSPTTDAPTVFPSLISRT